MTTMQLFTIVFLASSRLTFAAKNEASPTALLRKSESFTDKVKHQWSLAHADAMNARVDRDLFISQFLDTTRPDVEALHLGYLQSVFDSAIAMMLPAVKTDLGKHCFTYASILAEEFYAADGSAPDKLGLVGGANAELDADWTAVSKNSEGRVALESFKQFYTTKYSLQVQGQTVAFTSFLEYVFLSARMMMLLLPDKFAKGTLGGHCFRYAGLMVGEFYFGGKATDKLGVLTTTATNTRWALAHAGLVDGRVDQDMFVAAFVQQQRDDHHFRAYVEAIFKASTAMMLPSLKKDLGKHCFGYGALLANEFYTSSGSSADGLGLVSGSSGCDTTQLQLARASLNADFAAVAKDLDGRVNETAFVNFYMQKNAGLLAASGSSAAYQRFLHHCFYIGRSMMLKLPDKFKKNSLGGHCFRYSGLMAGEFYFDGSAANALSLSY